MTSIAADLLLDNGQIQTLHAAVPVTSALAVHNGKVLAYGDTARSLRGPATLVLDLEGGLALPGFVDAHIHLLAYGLGLNEVVLAGISDYAEIERRIAQRVRTQSPGEWITGSGWNQDAWGGIRPVRALLDRLSSLHPMVFTRKDGHSIWTNSLALQRAGITAETPDPAGGRIEHLEDGTPSGILAENAMALVLRCLPANSTMNEYRGLQRAMALASAAGITGLHDFEGAAARTAFAHALGAGALPLRVQMMIDLPAWRAGWPTEQTTNSGHPLLHTGHLKIFSDGALGSRTAAMLAPYLGAPDNRGVVVTPVEEVATLVTAAARAGVACAIHAIGDYANRFVLDAFERTRAEWQPRRLRPRIEHVQVLDARDLGRLARLGVVASMQPVHATSDMDIADRYWGERNALGYAWRSLLDHGTALAFGSDCPVESLDVLQGLYAAVTRCRPDGTPRGGWYPSQRLLLTEAVAAYTTGAAVAAQREHELGDLGTGKWADITVLDRDIFTAEPEALLETRVLATVVGGSIVYRRA